MERVRSLRVPPAFWAWFGKGHLAVGLVLLSLLSLTTVYRVHSTPGTSSHAVKSQASPAQQRNLKSTTFETAAPAAVYLPIPVSAYTRQPIHADRTLSPRRLPGSYYDRPPPSQLS